MIPIRDENPTQSVPWVNYLLIAINAAVWLWEVASEHAGTTWLSAAYGLVPRRMLADVPGEAFTVLSSMFMHGSWAHIGGNMLFLYIFGDNVEDALGHRRYVVFYLVSGIAAAIAQVAIAPSSTVPMIGASGAIAGVLGGYMVLYPRAPITVINPFFPLWLLFGPFFIFPAWLVMGEWFLWNLLPGVASIGGDGGGVAFFAHIGGFVAGLLLVRPFAQQVNQMRPAWSGWRPPPNSGGRGTWGSGGRGGRPWL